MAWRRSTPIHRRTPSMLDTSARIFVSAASTSWPWWAERSKSPFGWSCRSRLKASANRPSRSCHPGLNRAPDAASFICRSTSTSTPPISFTMSVRPAKPVTTYHCTGRPVSRWMVVASSCGPPKCSAALILLRPWPGMSTHESRGNPRSVPSRERGLTASRWMLSEWACSTSPPGRASVPTTSTHTRSVGTGTSVVKVSAGPYGWPSASSSPPPPLRRPPPPSPGPPAGGAVTTVKVDDGRDAAVVVVPMAMSA